MSRPGFALAPVFCVRAAGIAFDHLDALGSPAVSEAARRLLACEREVDREADAAIAIARAKFGAHERAERALLKRLVRSRNAPDPAQLAAHPWLAAYWTAASEYSGASYKLDVSLLHESARVHRETRRHAVDVLPDFAAIESEPMLQQLDAIAIADPHDEARSSDREADRSLAMYLQRVCAKGDTIGRFGPSGWGRVVPGDTLEITPQPRITARCIEVERWVVVGLIATLAADPELRPELCPRVHPAADLGELAGDARVLAERCDGVTPAHQLGDPAALSALVESQHVIWALERFAADSSPLASLIADVASWRPAARDRWLPRLERLRASAETLADAPDTAGRRAVIAAVRTQLDELGVVKRERGRTLYQAANPISENCYREPGFALGAGLVDRLVTDAAPWFDLFRDAYAYAAGLAFTRYRELVVAAPRKHGRLMYAELVAFASTRGLEIDNDKALLQIGLEAFAELGSALDDQFAGRADAPEWVLAPEDCHVLRRKHALPAVAEFAWPQADVQLAAASVAEANAGRYTWVVAELHHALMPLQHALYWSCPDKPALHTAMQATIEHRSFAVRAALTEQPVHNAGESVFAALPQATFVGNGRPKRGWRTVRPAEAEVIVDDEARDIRLRAGDGRDLGSLVRCFRTMMGMHPFFPFERSPHAPRLRLGSTVVQRQTWNLTSPECGEPRPNGVSPQFITAIERVRRDRGVPRWVFVRPSFSSLRTREGLRTHDVYARDKDQKPFYVDLESVLFLDILERRLRKYGDLVLSEMLPAPDQLVWSEDGRRYVFELRASIVPAT
ncbi:MAG: hypothetical protein WKG01_03365 [Kofleriaceae bacterium]